MDRPAASRCEPRFAPESLDSIAAEPDSIRLLSSSRQQGWLSLLVDEMEGTGECDDYDRNLTPDIRLVVALSGAWHIWANHSGRMSQGILETGSVGVNDGSQPLRLRWCNRHRTRPFRLAAVYLPSQFLVEAAEHLRRRGQILETSVVSSLAVNDITIAGTLFALAQASRNGASDVYAEEAARWLATHLVHIHGTRFDPRADNRDIGAIRDARLARVIEYISVNFGQPLSIADMAREAAVSPFHFSRLFHRSVGVTPQRYLTERRLMTAASLLQSTDIPVAEIAATCGYPRCSSFSTAFLRRFGATPSDYRLRLHN